MPSILIIDDEKQICETFGDLFTGEGFRVHVAHDGDQGIRIARAHLPDIILSDIRMPGINGHEAVKAFREIPGLASTPVILITGNADLNDMRQGMESGADDCLAKPVKLDDLVATINRHLNRSQTRRRALREELISKRHHIGAILPNNLIDALHEIIGCASVMEGDAHIMSPADIREFARDVISGAETLNQRFENFVLYARLHDKSLVISPPESVHLDERLTNAAQQVARRHHRTSTLRLEIDPMIATVSVDLLLKSVSEIIDNACRYSIAGEPIDVSLTAGESSFTIKVTDFGMGLADAQVASLDDDDRSQGYGMRLSRQLTLALGGQWHLDNQPKRGLAISFKYPLA
jgi:CheY-like chemotaxis protein/anti-sigma regulatory factor (Ser/Thr protein kinase)